MLNQENILNPDSDLVKAKPALVKLFNNIHKSPLTGYKYFEKIPHAITDENLLAIREEILSQDAFWLFDQTRQKQAPPQRHTHTIFLRGYAKPKPGESWVDVDASADSVHALQFPHAMKMIRDFSAQLGGELCRALYVKLLPYSVVYPHVDNGTYFLTRDRYHFVVDSANGSLLGAGDEAVAMKSGELWWFDNKAPHFSANLTPHGRIHLIFDLRFPSCKSTSISSALRSNQGGYHD